MSAYARESVERFGGLNLIADPGELAWDGAVDLLNVEFDRRGRIRSRDGFAWFTTAPALGAYHTLAPFYTTSGTKQLIAAFGGASGAVNALNTSGGIVAAQSAPNSTYASVARFAAPGSEHAYVAVSGSGAGTVYRWNGSAWSTPTWTGTTPTGRHLAVSTDGRLVNARFNGTSQGDSPSTVRFSDPGAPTTWGANNYLEISPGDGEEIMALVTWRDSTLCFKQSKFAVVYGTSVDSTGNPIFNNRLVTSQGLAGGVGGTAYRAIAVAPHGVYFANRRGIWLTTGGDAQLISRAVDPLFRGDVATPGPAAINQGAIDQCAMVWHDERLWFAYPSGSATTNDRLLRYDPETQVWSLYGLSASALASFRIGNSEELVFTFSGGQITLAAPPSVSATSSPYNGTYAANVTRYYKVTALNAAGETTASSEVSATTPASLSAPQALTIQGVGGLYSLAGSGSCTLTYSVTALNASGETIASSPYPPVSNPTETNRLTWGAVTGATSYRLYVNATGGQYPFHSPGSGYSFRNVGNVTSFDDDGGGTAWTAGSPPVSGTAATTTNSITISWGAVLGATGYRVYRGTTAGGESVYFAPGNVLTFTDTSAAGTGGFPPSTNTATTAGFDVARHSRAYTQDGGNGTTTGTAITSRYRSGFLTAAPSGRADGKRTVRQWHLRGTGTVTFGVAADDATAIPTSGGGASASVSLAGPRPNYRVSQQGNNFSWQIESSGAWTLNSVVAEHR